MQDVGSKKTQHATENRAAAAAAAAESREQSSTSYYALLGIGDCDWNRTGEFGVAVAALSDSLSLLGSGPGD
jgi:hypothetical protein